MKGLRHELRLLQGEPLLEVIGHADEALAGSWRDRELGLLEKKREIMEELPEELWTKALSHLRQGYGVRIVVTEPSHF